MMAKNRLLQMLEEARAEGFSDGLWKGLHIGINLYAITDNHVHGHGALRLDKSEAYLQKLVNEIVDVKDPEATEAHIRYELERIRGRGRRKKKTPSVTADAVPPPSGREACGASG